MLFNDNTWLRQNASHGPAARAAIGILVAKGDWAWWHSRSFVGLVDALVGAVPRSGVAIWGGDEAVLAASEWVDASLAIDLARAFNEVLLQRTDFRLKIQRTIWQWDALVGAEDKLLTYLASTVPHERAFFEWPKDRRPPRKTPDRQAGALIIAATERALGQAQQNDPGLVAAFNEGRATNFADWRPGAAVSDILVSPSIDLLVSGDYATDVVILTSDDRAGLVRSLDDIRRLTGAQCVIRLPQGGSRDWLHAFGRQWAYRAESIDDAVSIVNEETGLEGEIVASNQTFLLWSHRFTKLRTEGDLAGGGAVTYGKRKVQGAGLPPIEIKPDSRRPPPTARVLELDVQYAGRPTKLLPNTGRITITVYIHPKTPLSRNDVLFPDQAIEWIADKRTLQVHLLELGTEPATRSLILPRTGRSETAEFEYLVAGTNPVDLRFMVCDGPQILQTVRLQGKPGQRYEVFIETDVASIEERPRPFDFALLVNDSLGGKASLTTISDEEVRIEVFEGSDIETLRNEASDTLRAVASNPEMPFDEALKDLADVGSRMLGALRKWVKNWPESFTRVQLMTKVNAIFPFEFLYDGPLPRNANAESCPQSANCLASPLGTSCCPLRASREVFCPMGFLGLSTIIERHTWDVDQKHPFWLRRSEDFTKRRKLSDLNEIVFAASDKADQFSQDDTLPLGQRLARIADVEAAFKGFRAANWEEWSTAVHRELRPPSMAVLIPHVEGKKLFIGKSDPSYLSTLEMGEVSVAIIVGCNTAEGEVAALSLPNFIMQDGNVRVVIAALTEILGRHSNTAVLNLGTQLRSASEATVQTTVGEFVTALRRDFLAKGIVLGLVLVAIGDADVVLGKD